jgi:hypothetical protein
MAAHPGDIPVADRLPQHRASHLFRIRRLLRRHDYTVDVIANAATAHYTDAYRDCGRIIVATRRRALFRRTDGASAQQPVLVSIDLDDIHVE